MIIQPPVSQSAASWQQNIPRREAAIRKYLPIFDSYSITDTEERLLNDANEHLMRAGRYAAPAKETRRIPHETIMNMIQGEIKEERSLETLMSLYKRLKDIYLKESIDTQIKDQCLVRPFRVYR